MNELIDKYKPHRFTFFDTITTINLNNEQVKNIDLLILEEKNYNLIGNLIAGTMLMGMLITTLVIGIEFQNQFDKYALFYIFILMTFGSSFLIISSTKKMLFNAKKSKILFCETGIEYSNTYPKKAGRHNWSEISEICIKYFANTPYLLIITNKNVIIDINILSLKAESEKFFSKEEWLKSNSIQSNTMKKIKGVVQNYMN